ncbi:MAG: hypothetical protein OXN92_08040 [Gammaproteobacteria bacterium]|nr:hypothetical protein [Gammaproteobacteria bacterium]
MRWPWQGREKRSSGGSFTDAVIRLIEAEAAGTSTDSSSTAAVEAASGALSRALASARVSGPPHVIRAVSAGFLAQTGRDLIRSGQSMHVIRVSRAGRVRLLPAASWHFEGDADPSTWRVRATVYGSSSSTTYRLPLSGVVFAAWGATPGQPYTGVGPLRWASTTGRMLAEAEKHIGDESAGPRGNLLPVPAADDDKLAKLKAAVAALKGRALLTETTSTGFGLGAQEAPRQDFVARRLGGSVDQNMMLARRDGFAEVLAATGTPPSLFTDADGTAQREAFRRYLTMTVQPIARVLEQELSEKLETSVSLGFEDLYAHDLVGRASSFQKLVAAGVPVADALNTSGLMADG